MEIMVQEIRSFLIDVFFSTFFEKKKVVTRRETYIPRNHLITFFKKNILSSFERTFSFVFFIFFFFIKSFKLIGIYNILINWKTFLLLVSNCRYIQTNAQSTRNQISLNNKSISYYFIMISVLGGRWQTKSIKHD